ncbi:glutaredoxin domain-containing protein [Candidatus Harpocratesius sp.]
MVTVVLYTKSNCHRCSELKQWLQSHTIPFREKSLEDPAILKQIVQDPLYLNVHCQRQPCKIYPPVLYLPQSKTYIQNQLFSINGLRSTFLSNLFHLSSSKISQQNDQQILHKKISQNSSHSPHNTAIFPDSSSIRGTIAPKFCRNELVENLLRKYILAIGISRVGGDMLYSIQIDKSLNMDLISQFISALSMFGEENLGKIDRILIQGLEIEMSVVTRFDLIFFVLFRAHMVQDHLDEESEKCLEKFFKRYQPLIEKKRTNRALYENFDSEMCLSIQHFLVRIGILECVDCSLEIPILRERK